MTEPSEKAKMIAEGLEDEPTEWGITHSKVTNRTHLLARAIDAAYIAGRKDQKEDVMAVLADRLLGHIYCRGIASMPLLDMDGKELPSEETGGAI